jgi:hypothetical protein
MDRYWIDSSVVRVPFYFDLKLLVLKRFGFGSPLEGCEFIRNPGSSPIADPIRIRVDL